MGGHGGLNILPQKSWHVYRKDNVSKVERDEAKAKQQEDEAREKHENAEREYRRQLLLQRSGHTSGLPSTSGQQQQQLDDASVAAAMLLAAEAAIVLQAPQEAHAGQAALAVHTAPEAQQAVQHINFWSEDEARMTAEHPEVAVGSAHAAWGSAACMEHQAWIHGMHG